MAATAQPFRLHVADSAIDDLRERLLRSRFPDQAPGEPWAYGTDVDYLKQLVEYWHGHLRKHFDSFDRIDIRQLLRCGDHQCRGHVQRLRERDLYITVTRWEVHHQIVQSRR